MGEHFENYSETNWANDFLIEAKDQLPLDDLARFRGMLDANNIQRHEAHEFLDAFKNGKEALNQFLTDRQNGEQPKEQDHVVPLPKKKSGLESQAENPKTAA